MKIISNKKILTLFIFLILTVLGCQNNVKNNSQIYNPYSELENLPTSQRCNEIEKIAWHVYTDDGFYNTKILPEFADKCENFVADSFGGRGMLTLREQLDFQNQYFKGMMEAREKEDIGGKFFSVPNYDIYYYDNDSKTWIKTNISVNMTEYSKSRNDTEPLDVWLDAFKKNNK